MDNANKRRLNIGCGPNLKPGWCNIDTNPPADIQVDVRKGLPFEDASVDIIYSEHFMEHLSYPSESIFFLTECLRVLVSGGRMHVGVPDSRYVVECCSEEPIRAEFLEAAKKHNWGYPAFCRTGFEYINYHFRLGGQHKFAFDFTTLKRQLEDRGFINVVRREPDLELDTPSRSPGSLYVVAEKE